MLSSNKRTTESQNILIRNSDADVAARENFSEVMAMFYILFGLMDTWVYKIIKTHQTYT